jgi:N-acetylmuramoyl-L-alanine amidase
MRIGIDYGHNGPTLDPGAVGPAGTFESTRTLEIGRRLAEIIAANGYEVVEFRDSEDFVPDGYTDSLGDLDQRAAAFNEAGVIAVISLHCNAAENPDAQGIEIFTTVGPTGADPLAAAILAEMATAFPDHINRGQKEAGYYILKRTDAPAVLLEMEFISNPEQEAFLGDPDSQQKIAQAIFAGFLAWLRGR